MDTTYVFVLGVLIAIISVLPPGLLNMSAAKISLEEGRSGGIAFSIGAALIVLIQTFIAAFFARYLSMNEGVIYVLRFIAFGLFVLVTIYFLFLAKEKEKKKEPERKSKSSSFFYGVFLSTLNVFPIPFQAYITITLSSYGWMDFSRKSIFTYVTGVSIGSFLILYGYILFFNKVKSKTLTSKRNMNIIIGSITGIVAIITLINIINNF